MNRPNVFNGAKLRILREELGMSITGFAKKVGITPSSVSNLEKSIQTPSPSLLKRLADAVGVSPEDLCGVDDFYEDVDLYTKLFEKINKMGF